MTKVSPKHHQDWLKAKRRDLQKAFTLSNAKALKKAWTADQGLTVIPKAKWTPNVKSYVGSLQESKVVQIEALRGFPLTAFVAVISFSDEEPGRIGFFSSMGDPFLECHVSAAGLKWKPLLLTEKALAENRANYLKKLSISMKRQAGLAPPPKEKKAKAKKPAKRKASAARKKK